MLSRFIVVGLGAFCATSVLAEEEAVPRFGEVLLVPREESKSLKFETKYDLLFINGLKTGLQCKKHTPMCFKIMEDLYLLEQRGVSDRWTVIWDERTKSARPFHGGSSPIGPDARVILRTRDGGKVIEVMGVDQATRGMTVLWSIRRPECLGMSALDRDGERLNFVLDRGKEKWLLTLDPNEKPRELLLDLSGYQVAGGFGFHNPIMKDQLLLSKYKTPAEKPKTQSDPLVHDVAYMDLKTGKIHEVGKAEGIWHTSFGEKGILPIAWTDGNQPPNTNSHAPEIICHLVQVETHKILTTKGVAKE